MSRLARSFGEPLGLGGSAALAGILHDVGKATPAFQKYLIEAAAGQEPARGPGHKASGTALAATLLQPVSFAIAGHHGGLPSTTGLRALIAEAGPVDLPPSIPGIPALVKEGTQELSGLAAAPDPRLAAELAIRLLHSCLVDADGLDTERHWEPERSAERGRPLPDVSELAGRLDTYLDSIGSRVEDTPVNRVRAEVLSDCRSAAAGPRGCYTLTVPTGGGKSFSSLAFALRHAATNGLGRVVYAAPYISIIEQTADAYRRALGEDAGVLEHHSGNEPESGRWAALAAENWDAAVVVTTTVQVFESLFRGKPGSSRKLHNLAGSVLVLDEAQALPSEVLRPILDVLAGLCRDWDMTVVLCTATQPAFGEIAEFRDGPLAGATEIVEEPARHFERLRRVNWDLRAEEQSWDELADELRAEEQCLAVLNTRKDAHELLSRMPEGTLLLSTDLCPAHRRKVMGAVRSSLGGGGACRLVSTQVVEAGVDLDFPVVMRAVGPLDSIVQAAGRCNREGRIAGGGRAIVVRPREGKTPRGSYRTAAAHAGRALRSTPDLSGPNVFSSYFPPLYADLNLDAYDVQPKRRSLDFEGVRESFRMLDGGEPVLVHYDDESERLMSEARSEFLSTGRIGRMTWRKIQQHSVNLRPWEVIRGREDGLIAELVPGAGLLVWEGRYDAVAGRSEGAPTPSDMVI